MRGKIFLFVPLLTLGHITASGTGLAASPSHADRIGKYEGPQSCAPCHAGAAREVAVSLHYQQAMEPQFLVDWEKGKLAGQALSF